MAVKTKPIKTDLFKFVTLRTPQLIDEQKKDLGFIFHNEAVYTASEFLKSVAEEKDISKARTTVNGVAKEFESLEKLFDVKKINPSIYKFSSWLMDNRNTILKTESDQKIEQIAEATLTKEQENLLWDNLYYQVLTRKSSYVRQACIQMLIAHNFLAKSKNYDSTKFDLTEEAYLDRLANAKVVIDKAFTKEERKQTKSKIAYSKALKNLKNDTKKYYFKKNIAIYKSALNEIINLEFNYKKDYNKAFKIADDAHKVIVDDLIEQAEIVRKPLQDAENLAAKNENRDVDVIPLNVKLPKFTFEFENHFSDTYKDKLTKGTKTVLLNNSIGSDISLEETKLGLQERINQTINRLGALTKTKTKEVYVNGVKVTKNSVDLSPYCYVVNIWDDDIVIDTTDPVDTTDSADPDPIIIVHPIDHPRTDDDFINLPIANSGLPSSPNTIQNRIITNHFIVFKINLGNIDAQIVSQTHTLNTNQVTSTAAHTISLVDGIATLRLFSNETFQLVDTVNITGQFVLNNGTTLNYNVDVEMSSRTAAGCIDMNDDANDGNTGNDGTEPTEPEIANLYGIGKIGVADFRKVEQTVCCYVPGEVSHIENILAKEFKKRETRSLISSETTTETTTEKEVENLTDTTTTERNELQSEVANVLNEDQSQSYGASAGVTGKLGQGRFSANASADFANSSASSQSNTQSQTYAQEITERALERVVSKTSKKQTSRILKEFEENNQHGFDNRNGNQHVSGVYRWIDIIYKNQLVNYGKRLMYEFMIPEPARFYHDAINFDNESGSTDDGEFITVNKPIHPSELDGILKLQYASDLRENNYLQLASIYNVEVKAKPKAEIGVTKGFDAHETNGNDKNKSGNGTISIPDGYQVTSAKASLSFAFHPTGVEWTRVAVNIGNRQYSSVINDKQVYDEDINFLGINNVQKELAIAYTVMDCGVFGLSVVANCSLTESAKQEWQNETYKAILDGYYEQVDKYNEYLTSKGLDQALAGDKEQIRFSNSFNRILEVREIKRICIEMLVTPYHNSYGQDNYTTNSDGYEVVNQNESFENHAAHIKFFEQAFDWDIMAYRFYDYFWANRGKWETLFQKTSSADPIFQAFLQSGMARAVVPVKPGFEDAVAYYIETGDIWNGGDLVIDQDNDLYISIAEEMQNIEGDVEAAWETRVPTALTIIQKDTIGLEETGLPCCNDGDLKPEEKPIQAKATLIGGDNPIVEDPKV